MVARVLEIAPIPDKMKELIGVLNQQVVPILKEQPGFVETLVFAPENTTDKIMSVTFWAEKRFAERYAREAYPMVEQIIGRFLSLPITVKRYTVESMLAKHWGRHPGRSNIARSILITPQLDSSSVLGKRSVPGRQNPSFRCELRAQGKGPAVLRGRLSNQTTLYPTHRDRELPRLPSRLRFRRRVE